jgi:hypothetical protein
MDTSSDRAHVCLHITTIHISLPPLLLPETRLRPSLLERSLTTGCGAIARVGSVHHIAFPSAMRRTSRGHVPGSIGGDRGNRAQICKSCCFGAQCGFLRLESLTQVPRVSNAQMRKVVLDGCEFSHNTTSLVCDLSSRTTTSVKKLEIDFRSCRLWKALLLIDKCCCCALRVLRFSNFLVHNYVCVRLLYLKRSS